MIFFHGLRQLQRAAAFFKRHIMEDEKTRKQGMDIELPVELAEGVYSNLAMVTHSNSEFVVDFMRIMPGVPKPRVKSRVVLTPQHAKRLLAILSDNISRFEAMYGRIQDDVQKNIPFDMSHPAEA